MSKKYIKQLNDDNFVFPNNTLAEYDVNIIHDLKDNSVNGVITGFSPLTYSASTESVGISFTYQWALNGAEPFISNDGKLNILSVHMQSPDKKYYKPWICVGQVQDNNVSLTGKTDIFTVFVTPEMMGQERFTTGTFYFEIRFIGHRAIFPVSVSAALVIPTPTPTPSPTPTGPTPTPGGPTPTPTPTSTPSSLCYCFPIVVTGSTLPPPEGGTIATLVYNDCFGVQTVRAFTTGPGTYYQCIEVLMGVPQYNPLETEGIDQSYINLTYLTGDCRTGYDCSGYVPATTPTPTPTTTGVPPTATPTPTATGEPATATPTPTPTAEPATPTPTPTATSVPATPTPTPTATSVPLDCVTSVSFEVDAAGDVSYLNCCGTPVTGFYGIGPQVINDCIDVGTLAGAGATISSISYGSTSCTCVTPTPTPTATAAPATPTPTATSVPFYTYEIGQSNSSSANACSNFSMEPLTEVYADTNSPLGVTRFYTDTNLITPFSGSGSWYAWRLGLSGAASHSGQVDSGGNVTNTTTC